MGIDGGRQVGSVGGQTHWLCLLSKKLVPNLSAIQIIKAQENKIPVCIWKRTSVGILKCTKTKEGQIYLIKTQMLQTEVNMLTIQK